MFRRPAALLLTALALVACDRGPTESVPLDEPAFELVLEAAGQGEAAGLFLERAPEALRLTPEQREAIAALNRRFVEANRADLEALRRLTALAMRARREGQSPEEIRAILERGRPIRQRLAPAFLRLHVAVQAVLTPEQRAWLRANAERLGPGLPRPLGPPPGAPPRP